MSFPLFRRPGAVVFLDDDPDYLEMLALVLPDHWHVELFLRPQACINYLQQEPPLWEADAWEQQQIIERGRAGSPLIPQILDYWRHSKRYSLTHVCVVDYSMPSMDGLDTLGELYGWPGSRVLLTGQADEQVAVTAFNRGLIDQFIPKQRPDASKHLMVAVERLLDRPHSRHSSLWRSTLTPQQNAVLQIPSVAKSLREFIAGRWVEYVVIGSPFGILGLQDNGVAEWLQIEQASSLPDLADLAQSEGLPAHCLAEILAGHQLLDLELQQSLGHKNAPVMRPAFFLGSDNALLAAIFQIDEPTVLTADSSYKHWLSQHAGREIHS